MYILAKNRKALHNFTVLETFVAGVVLRGYEVKAIREGKVSFEGAYIDVIDGRPYLVNLYIGRYSKQSRSFSEEDSKRNRMLLLNQGEVSKVARAISEKGKAAVPLSLGLKNGMIKLEFAVVRGKKEFEKKIVVKERQIQRDLERESKEAGAR
ncbi:MAG: SsrA-binding protein [Patescibacteria group bacterium]|nr:MAG: SsrA-binding protein [Patescibacteria group bacterium]